MFLRSVLIAALLALPLAGCASVPLGSIVPLARIDLMTTDLTALRAALRLPPVLRPQPSGVQMDVVLKVNGEPDETLALPLVETRDPADLAQLPASGDPVYVYRLAAPEVARFEALRKALAAYQASHTPGSLGIGIASREFCRTGAVPPGPIVASTYLHTSENSGFVTLLEGFDLRGDPKLAAAFADIPLCEAPAH